MVYAAWCNFLLESRIILTLQLTVSFNIFKFSSYSVHPIINGLSDHDARCIVICNIFEQNSNTYFYFNRKIDKSTIMDFNETKVFKKTLQNFLMDNAFYSVDEVINFRE
jgi:hypothetical protein